MANWRLYTEDALAYRFGSSQVSASSNPTLAPRVVAVNPASLWTKVFASGSPQIYFDLGSTVSLEALAFANHDITGTVFAYHGSSFGAETTLREQFDLTPGVDTVVDFDWDIRYLSLRINSANDHTVGSICALTTAGMIEIDAKSAPLFGDAGHLPGYSGLVSAGGVSLRQVTSATRKSFVLTMPSMDTADGGTGAALLAQYEATNGFANGLWVTDYTYGEDTAGQGKGVYCEVTPGSGLQHPTGPVAQQATVQLSLTELPRGPR